MEGDRTHRVLAVVLFCTAGLVGCVQAVPPDLVAAVEAIDHDLIVLRAPETAPEEYGQFVRQCALLKATGRRRNPLALGIKRA